MEVQLKDVKPNPFRHLENYPIDQVKVNRLQQSIQHTGFWDNLVARKINGKYEIAYGHHRLAALTKEYSQTHKISLIIKNIDDATMIKIMADENDEKYVMNPAVINETVKVAKDYLTTSYKPQTTAVNWEKEIVSFLNWPAGRVKTALATLNAIEKGELVKEVEELPTQAHIENFRATAKSLTPAQQRDTIKRIKEKSAKGEIGHKGVRKEVLQTKYRKIPKSKEQKNIDFLEYLYKELYPLIDSLCRKIDEIDKYKQYISGAKGFVFWKGCQRLQKTLNSFLTLSSVKKQITKQ